MQPVICITRKQFEKGRDVFTACSDFSCRSVPAEEERLAQKIIDKQAYAAIVGGSETYCDQLYKALPEGGVIARFGVGHEGIDKAKATQHGLLATNTPGTLEDSVAEHTVLLMGCAARKIAEVHRHIRNNHWEPVIGSELRDKNLLIVGCGRIGCRTARIASFGFGMRVVGYDVARLNEKRLSKEFGIQKLFRELGPALEQADFVSLHVPATPETRHLVDRDFLAEMKPRAQLINMARGSVVEECALYNALDTGIIAGAALDVFDEEPYVPVDPDRDLRTLDNVLLTPHMGTSTQEACRRMARCCINNIRNGREQRFDEMQLLNPRVKKEIKQ